MSVRRGSGVISLRVLIAVTHLLGAGHLTRAAAIARAFLRAGHDVTLISGGMPATLVSTEGVRLIQLPPVRTQGADFTKLLDPAGTPIGPEYLAQRRRLLLAALDEAKPDVVITELFPFGRRVLADEFIALVQAARGQVPAALIIASVRDILVASAKPERIAETRRLLSQFYSAVLVHGDARLAPLDLSWPVDDELRALIRYTGYVDDGSPVPVLPPEVRHEVIVSGGSSAASLPLFRAALGAAQLVAVADRPWRLLVGAGVAEVDFTELRRSAPDNVVVERARPDFRTLLGAAAVSVSQAGYNTVVDLLRAQTPAVLVPFEVGQETEQRLRAQCLARHGLARVLPEQELSPAALAEAVRAALGQTRAQVDVRLDGADTTVGIVEALAREKHTSIAGAGASAETHPPHSRASGNPDALEKSLGPRFRGDERSLYGFSRRYDWSRIDNLLSRAADAGRTVAFWWRDDDATAHTPALDRLLDLARHFEIPVALAAVPARLEASLMRRVAAEPDVQVLVHGLSHANYAPRGQKKAEFGSHRPPETLVAEAAEALHRAKETLGQQLLPVFVPPWNRVADALTAELPRLGYRGISRFGPRDAREAVAGLLQINTHLDPINWEGTRGLVPPDILVGRVAGAIAARIDGTADPEEPIGILSHHLSHDEDVWHFCQALLDHLSKWGAVRFYSARLLFPSRSRAHVTHP